MADSSTITITGLSEFEQKLEQLKTTNPGFERRLRAAIRAILANVRKKMSSNAQTGLQMQSDPRHAYKAVRYAVYRRIFGGQVNILDAKGNATGDVFYEPPRHPSRRGGNRIKRPSGGRTEKLMSYSGSRRGFVLRFLNAGTQPRYIGGRNGKTLEQRNAFILKHEGRGYRGRIAQRNWFGPASQREMEIASANIQKIIDKIINEEFV